LLKHAVAEKRETYLTKNRSGLSSDLRLSEDPALASRFYHIVGAIQALHNDPTSQDWAGSER